MFKDIEKHSNKRKISKHILRILILSICFNLGIYTVFADPIKILNNSRHAYSTIDNTIALLLGRDPNLPLPEFVIHSTVDGTFSQLTSAINTSASYYDESNNLVPSQAPYHIYSNSFSGYPGDSVSVYNAYAAYDLTDNYAFQSTASLKMPPTFRTAPGGGTNYASSAGVEWKLDPVIYPSSGSLSGATAANTGVMAWLRYGHPTWNWFDVKAAMRQSGTNWLTGYSPTMHGFGIVNATTTNALADGDLLLQPPAVATSTSGIYSQITFTVYPFRQTRRIKEVLFQFASNPGFQADELTLTEIQTLGGTKITEYAGTTATTTAPISSAVTSAYFVWFTADSATDSSANFSRIDTYNILGPLSQSDVPFSASFDISTPANNAIASSTSPTFTWNTAQSGHNISKYQLFIDGALDTDNISGTSTTPTSALSEGTHTWYIKAFNGNGTATSSVSTRTVNVISGYASGHTFYVDNVLGDNNEVGSQAAPWASITKAASAAQAGDTVIIIKNDGEPYRETFTPQAGNATDGSITFRGIDVSSKPEIWGSADVSGGWSSYGGGNPNTYQKTLTAYPTTVMAGSSVGNLSKRTQQADNDPASLAPGEWAWSSNLYYRLNSGEDIATLHIEASQRTTAVVGRAYNTFKDLIVRYVNGTGISIPARSIGERIEVYDSSTGVLLSGSGSSENSPGAVLRYSNIAGNVTYGIQIQLASYVRVYNNVLYDNTTGLYVQLWAHDSIVRNNTFTNNTDNITFSIFSPITNFVASHNNWYSGALHSSWTDTYQGTNNQDEVVPLLTDVTSRNFRLQHLSPNIDSGISISGLTTDILGNPIYGTPDIGPYEYQPPYQITTEKIPLTGSIRLYKDGKYRTTMATSSAATANMTITPEGGFPSGDYGEFLNVTINSWNTSGDYSRSWTESSSSAGATTHTVGDLAPNAFYAVAVDGTRHAQFRTDASGQGTFTYSGGYSTHTFSIAPDLSVGGGPIVGSSFGFITDSASSIPTPPTATAVATPTQLVATTSTPMQITATTTIQEQVIELQTKLISLLKELVALLSKQLQNIKKTI